MKKFEEEEQGEGESNPKIAIARLHLRMITTKIRNSSFSSISRLLQTGMTSAMPIIVSFDENNNETDDVHNDVIEEEDAKINGPVVGQLFDNLDEMFDYYKKYAKYTGFPVKRRTSKKGTDGILKYVTFVCARSGTSKCKSSNVLKSYPHQKIDCKARIGGVLDNGKWRLKSFTADHNHPMSPKKSRFYRCNREMSANVKRQLEVNDRAGIRPNKNYNSFVVQSGGHENMSFLEKDCRNYLEKVRRLRLGEGDATAIKNYFMKMQAQDVGFFFNVDINEKGRLKNVFWADSRSRAAYKEFSEVITFDTTYLTNKYDMPFAPFVGVNHHGQSTLFGCGLISNEDTSTFVWLFQTWLTCMGGCAPSGIITDQDRAMKNAIEVVFPKANHRWCLWHIMKKTPEKLGSYNEYDSIRFALHANVYDCQSPLEFELGWSTMIEKYNLHTNDWLSGLYIERHRWVPCYVKNKFWAGMSTTQRSESMNAFFDGYVNSKTTLKQFVEQYENAIGSKIEKENQADFLSFSKLIPCVTAYGMEKQVQNIYTISKFKEFQTELTGKMYCEFTSLKEDIVSEYDIREDVIIGEGTKRVVFKVTLVNAEQDVKCSCYNFEFRGMLCRHALAVLIRNDILLLPEKYIMKRWRKDVRRGHTRVKINHDGWIVTPEHLRYDKMCTSFSKVADLAADTEENYMHVMDYIENAMNDLKQKKESQKSNQPTDVVVAKKVYSEKTNVVANESPSILDPLVTRRKGRPPTKRKQSNIPKKTRQKKQKASLDSNDVHLVGSSNSQITNNISYPTLTLGSSYSSLLCGFDAVSHPMPVRNPYQEFQHQLWSDGYGLNHVRNCDVGALANIASHRDFTNETSSTHVD